MGSDGIPKFLQFSVDGLLPERRLKCERIEEEVNVFREPLDQIPALRQACAAFQDRLVARGLRDDSQRLGDIVILLDDCRAQPLAAKMLRRRQDRLLEVGMFKELHVNGAPSLARPSLASAVFQRGQHAEIKPRERIQGRPEPLEALRPLAELFTGGPQDSAHPWRLGIATPSRRSNRPFSESSASSRRIVSSGDNSLVSPLRLRKSNNAASVSERTGHASGRRAWTMVSRPMSLRGRLSELVATSRCPGFCVVKRRRLAAVIPEGKTAFRRPASFCIAAGLGRLGPNAVCRGR